MTGRQEQVRGITGAVITAAIMIAGQVSGKAVRDALFLSRFPVTALPAVILASTLLSIATALLYARLLTKHGPHRVLPASFFASAAGLLLVIALGTLSSRGQAVALYLHVSVLGMVQISGFWSLVTEAYDPRTAKAHIGQIAAGGTLGGLVGGVLAERTGAGLGLGATLPLLAGLHAACASSSLLLLRHGGTHPPGRGAPGPAAEHRVAPAAFAPAASAPARTGPTSGPEGATRLGLRVLGQTPYLRSLALLVLLGALAAAFMDYVFKMQAARETSGGPLLRLFAGYYMAVSLVTFLIQVAASRRVLERAGLARAVSALPWGAAAGSLGALMAPGPVSAGLARGLESVLRNSLYRAGYEALFAPLPPREKRATKTIVDVGIERIGDAIGAAVIQVVLLVSAMVAAPILLGLAMVCSLAGVAVTRRLREGYVAALERGLLTRARELRLDDAPGAIDSDLLTENLGSVAWSDDSATLFLSIPVEEGLLATARGQAGSSSEAPSSEPATAGSVTPAPWRDEGPPGIPWQRIGDLHSTDPSRVRAAILACGPIDRILAPHVIPLLAWEAVADAAGQALRAASARIAGQLVDALLDPEEEFAIRRRIPRLLSEHLSPVAVEGLLQGLLDRRFEVRLRCGRALARVQEGAGILSLDADRVYLPVLREVAVDRTVWESRRLLELPGDDDESAFVDSVLRERASRSLEHVFTMLSLVLPRAPLQVAFRGLYADDPTLRGTALEYLESVLPAHVREALWHLLDDRRPTTSSPRAREDVLADLLRSYESIAIDLRAFSGPGEAD